MKIWIFGNYLGYCGDAMEQLQEHIYSYLLRASVVQ